MVEKNVRSRRGPGNAKSAKGKTKTEKGQAKGTTEKAQAQPGDEVYVVVSGAPAFWGRLVTRRPGGKIVARSTLGVFHLLHKRSIKEWRAEEPVLRASWAQTLAADYAAR